MDSAQFDFEFQKAEFLTKCKKAMHPTTINNESIDGLMN